jgi:NAD(P)-dependent dehydrogenase (short-subunit alcohol dehydrogenase family)
VAHGGAGQGKRDLLPAGAAMNTVLDLESRNSLRGKRILITGGSRGIGQTLAQAFLEEGASVCVCARHADSFTALRGAGALTQITDVRDPEDIDRLIRRIEDAWGALDAVVNNAGVLREGSLTEQPFAVWRDTLDVNLTGPFLVVRGALQIMDQGNIVNVSSGLGRVPRVPYGAYGVAKAGLNMLTKILALELKDRWRVNAIEPGEIRTRMNPNARDEPETVVPLARALVGLDLTGPTGKCYRKDGSEAPWG